MKVKSSSMVKFGWVFLVLNLVAEGFTPDKVDVIIRWAKQMIERG